MSSREAISPTRARQGDATTVSVPAQPDHGENSASTLVEAPLQPRRGRLEAHDFPDGGGSGGAERYSRRNLSRRNAKY